ncbi:MAG: SRPBCC domain-containing protein [Saprospiraceae bacterium]
MQTQQTIQINTSAAHLWDVLTLPEFTKKYMFNCGVNSNWELGGPITWEGNYQGYEVFQKGSILEIEKFKRLKYSTFDPNYGMEDIPENYTHITYAIEESESGCALTIINEKFNSGEEHADSGWDEIMNAIKEVAEL